jgi:hypothetical protein
MAGGVVVLQVRYREHKNEEEHKGEGRGLGGREEEKKLAVRETAFAFLDEERESAEVRGNRRNSTVKVVSFADGEGTEGKKKGTGRTCTKKPNSQAARLLPTLIVP